MAGGRAMKAQTEEHRAEMMEGQRGLVQESRPWSAGWVLAGPQECHGSHFLDSPYSGQGGTPFLAQSPPLGARAH